MEHSNNHDLPKQPKEETNSNVNLHNWSKRQIVYTSILIGTLIGTSYYNYKLGEIQQVLKENENIVASEKKKSQILSIQNKNTRQEKELTSLELKANAFEEIYTLLTQSNKEYSQLSQEEEEITKNIEKQNKKKETFYKEAADLVQQLDLLEKLKNKHTIKEYGEILEDLTAKGKEFNKREAELENTDKALQEKVRIYEKKVKVWTEKEAIFKKKKEEFEKKYGELSEAVQLTV